MSSKMFKTIISLGSDYEREGDYIHALECYKSAAQIDPSCSNIYYKLSRLELGMRNYEHSLLNSLIYSHLISSQKEGLLNDKIILKAYCVLIQLLSKNIPKPPYHIKGLKLIEISAWSKQHPFIISDKNLLLTSGFALLNLTPWLRDICNISTAQINENLNSILNKQQNARSLKSPQKEIIMFYGMIFIMANYDGSLKDTVGIVERFSPLLSGFTPSLFSSVE